MKSVSLHVNIEVLKLVSHATNWKVFLKHNLTPEGARDACQRKSGNFF